MTRKTKSPAAPRHLAPATRAWWRSTVDRWILEEHDIRILTLAGEAWDQKEEARRAVKKHGLTTRTRDGGVKLNPAARIEQDCRIAFARLIRELNLDVVPPEAPRGPTVGSRRKR